MYQKLMDRKPLTSALALLCVAIVAFSLGAYVGPAASPGAGFTVAGYVTVSHYRDVDGDGVLELIFTETNSNLITNAGKDFIADQLGSTTPGTNGANYIALSSDATAPAATDTSLTGEITSGGLERAQGTYAHTAGTNTYTVTHTFTATASHTDVQKSGLFTAATGGVMMAENTFSAVNLLSGDQLQIEWTITIS